MTGSLQSLSHAARDSSLCTREPALSGIGTGSVQRRYIRRVGIGRIYNPPLQTRLRPSRRGGLHGRPEPGSKASPHNCVCGLRPSSFCRKSSGMQYTYNAQSIHTAGRSRSRKQTISQAAPTPCVSERYVWPAAQTRQNTQPSPSNWSFDGLGCGLILRQHRTIWQEHSAKDFASYESYKRAGILYVFPPFITARMGQKIGRRPQTQLCGDALTAVCTSGSRLRRCRAGRRPPGSGPDGAPAWPPGRGLRRRPPRCRRCPPCPAGA